MSRTYPLPGTTPSVLVIFGITGDLSRRKVLPALYHLLKNGLLHDKTVILGVSRRQIEADELLRTTELCVLEDSKVCDPVVLGRLHKMLRMHQMDMAKGTDFEALRTRLDDIEHEMQTCLSRLYYLAVPPSSYQQMVEQLGSHGLNAGCQHGVLSRLLIEKPFGSDLASAERLIACLTEQFEEEQIFRIDHYMAKETAQNILAFRFNNPLFESLWNNRHITRIAIEASEQIGIEGRANFYEGVGALRDIIQSHLLQLLALVAMEPPADDSSASIHAARLQVLRAIQPADPKQAAALQYEGYRQEVDNADSTTETFASLTLAINTDRWRGVPVRMRTGKNLADKRTAVVITFDSEDATPPNHFRIYLQPTEGISVGVRVKQPGFEHKLETAEMEFSYARSFGTEPGHPDAYERVMVDAIRGDRTLFTSSDEVVAAWRIVQPLLTAWQNEQPATYRPGTPIEDADPIPT